MTEAGPPAVLIVEDDEAYRYALRRSLELAGCAVIAVGSYEEALAVLESERRIDLMVTDVILPQVHGFFLARLAVVRRPNLNIMYMSARRDLPPNELHFALGRFVPKPEDMDILVAEIKAELAKPKG
jgi:two-component system cell cycle sensor histidine kinase/response regulator CckA